jgi:hypothetical protein
MAEVGGLDEPPRQVLGAQNLRLGQFVPQILHGYRRDGQLSSSIAAINIEALFRGQKDEYRAKYSSGARLRRKFRLKRDAEILLVSVGHDQPLENFWAWRKTSSAIDQLKELNVCAVTIPNFSFFDDAPRFHTIWNRRRMIQLSEEFSSAGFVVIPHLNALSRADWDFWADYLKDQPSVSFVAKEFQTGNKNPHFGMPAIEHLDELQQRLGRPLSPIAIGATQYLQQLAARFDRFTIVDSKAFMSTVKRRRLCVLKGRLRQRQFSTEQNEPLDRLLEENVGTQRRWIASQVHRVTRVRRKRQLELQFIDA